MNNASIDSVSEFLLHAGTEYKVFDLGRGISEIEHQVFLDIEGGRIPAPSPRQQHAWFAFVFWNKNASQQRYIWFVKFPIDEQGLVIPASRNHFLQIIVDALGNQFAQSDNGDDQKTLPDNPYSFVPTQSQMARFNAFVKRAIAESPTQSTLMVKQYISNPDSIDWQSIPVQAVFDTIVSLDENTALADEIIENFDIMHPQFKKVLFEAAESAHLPAHLKRFFIRYVNEADSLDLYVLIALSTPKPDNDIKQLLQTLLSKENVSMDLLSVVAGRHYHQLDDTLVLLFFEQAANVDNAQNYAGAMFAGFFSDLVQIPDLRKTVLGMLRTEKRSDTLGHAIGRLFSQTKGAQH